jgi:hypothetical protein
VSDCLDVAIAAIDERRADETMWSEVVDQLEDACLDGELRIRAPWMDAEDRARLIAEIGRTGRLVTR